MGGGNSIVLFSVNYDTLRGSICTFLGPIESQWRSLRPSLFSGNNAMQHLSLGSQINNNPANSFSLLHEIASHSHPKSPLCNNHFGVICKIYKPNLLGKDCGQLSPTTCRDHVYIRKRFRCSRNKKKFFFLFLSFFFF